MEDETGKGMKGGTRCAEEEVFKRLPGMGWGKRNEQTRTGGPTNSRPGQKTRPNTSAQKISPAPVHPVKEGVDDIKKRGGTRAERVAGAGVGDLHSPAGKAIAYERVGPGR